MIQPPRFSQSWLAVFIMFLATSCTYEAITEPALAEIISHTSENVAPIWRGITPGQTTQAEFDLIVAGNSGAFGDLQAGYHRPSSVQYIWFDEEFRIAVSMILEEDVVSSLRFGLPGGEFPFGKLIELTGSPTAFLASPITDEYVDVNLFYTETGVAITFYAVFEPEEMLAIERNCQFPLTRSSLIEKVNIFFVEKSDAGTMANSLFADSILPDETIELWTGAEVIRSTSGQTVLPDGEVVDCRYP